MEQARSEAAHKAVVTDDSPTISLRLDSSPETLTLVRGMLGGVAELLQLDPELLDDLKTAVSEACNNVVMHAYEEGSGPLWVCLYVEPDGIEVVVRDRGRGIPELTPSDDRLQGVGIPIMRALAMETAFRPLREGGVEVWMQFASRRDGRPLYTQPVPAAPEDGWTERLDGDAVVSLSPVSFVGGVLSRLARAMAARPTLLAGPLLRRLPGHRRAGGACGPGCERFQGRVRDLHRYKASRGDDRPVSPRREL